MNKHTLIEDFVRMHTRYVTSVNDKLVYRFSFISERIKIKNTNR